MSRNGIWDVLFILDPRNKKKKWDLFLNHYIFTLYCVKQYVKSLQKGSKADKYMVQNLT